MSDALEKIKGKLDSIMSPISEGLGQSNLAGDLEQQLKDKIESAGDVPEVSPPIEMPDPVAQANAERRKSLKKHAKRKGRASTIMTQNNETL